MPDTSSEQTPSVQALCSLVGFLLAVAILLPSAAPAQTPAATVEDGSNNVVLQSFLDGQLLAPGPFGSGTIPASGSGTRMMWWPNQAAFRAGRVFDDSGGGFFDGSDFWNASNVGRYSVAFGKNTKATGEGAVAMGEGARALAPGATAMGRLTTASEDGALSVGVNNGSSVGSLFVVGNGGDGFKSNALVLDQDGNLSIEGVFESGPAAATFAGHFQGNKTQSEGNRSAHIALVENTGGSDADGLAIQAGQNTDPTNSDNFITFFDGDGDAVGAIQGNGSGGTERITTGSDYAEELPVARGASVPEQKSIVGVHGGEVRLETEGADRLMVVSTAPALTGNTTPSTAVDDDRRVAVAFVGQVPARVRGKAEVGDLIVASGFNDGTARAVAPGDYRRVEHGPIAGQAWSAKTADTIGEVTVAVGLGRSGAVSKKIRTQQSQIAALKAEHEQIEKRLAALEAGGRSVAAGWFGKAPFRTLTLLLLGGVLGAALLHLRRR